nr:reverse transcriptase domain-containing protein [Tanacetum cinerariifolium]
YSKPEDPNELFQKLLGDLKELAEYRNSQSRDRPIFLNDDEDHSDQNKECFENSSDEIATSNYNEENEEPRQDFYIHQLIEKCSTEEVKNIVEQPVERKTHIEKSLQKFRVIHKISISLKNTSQISPVHAVAPILSTKEPEYSPSMGYEHSNTTSEIESNEIIKSGVEELIPILSEDEVTLEDKRECDMLVCEDSSTSDVCDNHFDIFSDSKIDDDISVYDDDFEDIEYVEASLSDPEIVSVKEENPDQERLINLMKNDISNDSRDPLLEEDDLFLASDNSIPPGIENFADDSEVDIRFLKELLIDDFILSHETSDSNFEDNPLLKGRGFPGQNKTPGPWKEVSSKTQISKQFYQNNQALKLKYQRLKHNRVHMDCHPDNPCAIPHFDQTAMIKGKEGSKRLEANFNLSTRIEKIGEDLAFLLLDIIFYTQKHYIKLPETLGDPGKFLIPGDFPGKAECLALADLGASINQMPLSVWNKLSLPDFTPMCMTLELADHSISCLVGVAEDVYVKVGSFHFPADFVVIDFDADPRVTLILGRSFLKTERALIDVFEGELTLRVGKEAITFNLDQTSRYSANYSDMTAKRIGVIDMACEEYSQEVLGFSDVITSGNPTPYYDPIVSTTSPTLTLFGNSDFLLEEVDAFLAIEYDPTSPKVDQCYLDPEGDILLLEAFLNDDPSLPPPNQGNYLPEVRKELKICEAKYDKSSIDKPPEVKLKDLPPHLEYVFLEGDDNPVHCVPKKGGFTVVENEDNELIPTYLVMGWRVCIDYYKLNETTRNDHFPLPFMDQMQERLPGNQYYCFLDGFSGYFQIPIDLKDREKTTFTCP